MIDFWMTFSFSVYLMLVISSTYALFKFIEARRKFRTSAFNMISVLISSIFFDSIFWTTARLYQTGIIPLSNPISQFSRFISNIPVLWIIPKGGMLLSALYLINELRGMTRKSYFEEWIREIAWN